MEKINEQHTVVIPSYNTLEHLKNTYKSLKKYAPTVKIIIIDDASKDGTSNWLNSLQDKLLTTIISNTRKGHTYWYDEGIKISKTDIVSILHSDMIIGPRYFENMLKHLKPKTVVCATRIEPPIHPPGKEKIVKDFGDEANIFNWEEFEKFTIQKSLNDVDKITKGIFAPWMIYKKDHLKIGGHDQTFSPYGYEDSDIFNRWILEGFQMVQSRDSLCYHMTCRGHRWNKGVGIVNDDYESTMNRCRRDFIRKWGDWIRNDEFQFPIINSKYNVGFVVKNCNIKLLELLEPWCSNIYVDEGNVPTLIKNYTENEDTSFDLYERIKSYNNEKNNDILIEMDGTTLTQEDFNIIQQLSEILKDSGEIGEFELGNLKITINSLTEYQNDLINC